MVGPSAKRIAERDAEFDDIGAGFGQRKDEFLRSFQRRIASRNIGDDAHFAGGAKLGEAAGDSSRRDIAECNR